MEAGFLPEKKQKLPGLLKPGLRSPGTFLPSYSLSQSDYKANPDSRRGEMPHLHGACAYREGRGCWQLSLEVICHSEEVPIPFLQMGVGRDRLFTCSARPTRPPLDLFVHEPVRVRR